MKIERANERNKKEVEVDCILDVIIVTLLDKHGNMRSAIDFPLSPNILECCNNGGIAISIAINQTVELETYKKETIMIK